MSPTTGWKQSWCAGCSPCGKRAWHSSSRMRKWATGNQRSSSGTWGAWHRSSRTILFAPSGPFAYHRTYKPCLPARLTAVSMQPPTLRTNFARSIPSLPQRACPLRRPTIQPDHWIASKSCRARMPHWGRHKPTAARSPDTATTRTSEAASVAPLKKFRNPTSVGTIGVSGTKLENAPNRAPAIRKTPPPDVITGGNHLVRMIKNYFPKCRNTYVCLWREVSYIR